MHDQFLDVSLISLRRKYCLLAMNYGDFDTKWHHRLLAKYNQIQSKWLISPTGKTYASTTRQFERYTVRKPALCEAGDRTDAVV
jgi:hypothetical protein